MLSLDGVLKIFKETLVPDNPTTQIPVKILANIEDELQKWMRTLCLTEELSSESLEVFKIFFKHSDNPLAIS